MIEPDKPHVLIVEDEPALNRAYMLLMMNFGWHAVGAGSAGDAMEHLHRPDAAEWTLVLCDFWLPDAPGTEVVAAVHSLGLPARTVVLTAAGDDKSIQAIMAVGPDKLYHKPVGFEQLRGYFAELKAEFEARRKPKSAKS
jgi:DNA-binding NtrC family response regulator